VDLGPPVKSVSAHRNRYARVIGIHFRTRVPAGAGLLIATIVVFFFTSEALAFGELAYVQVFDYVQLNPPVAAGVFISRQVGALSTSVLRTQLKNH
jgi:ABC-type arginine transport system permease subunit